MENSREWYSSREGIAETIQKIQERKREQINWLKEYAPAIGQKVRLKGRDVGSNDVGKIIGIRLDRPLDEVALKEWADKGKNADVTELPSLTIDVYVEGEGKLPALSNSEIEFIED